MDRWAVLVWVLFAGCGRGECPTLRNPEPATPAREHCLAPPWVAAEGESIAGFTRAAVREDQRVQRWERTGTREATAEELGVVVEANSRAWMERLSAERVGVGTCGPIPGGASVPRGALCIDVGLSLCASRVQQVLEAVGTALAATPATPASPPGLADATVRVAIELTGAAGPRCASTDRACLPIPYSGSLESAGYDCTDDRVLASDQWPDIASRMEGYTGGSCRHDGECIVAGCGNHCVAWDTNVGAGTCEAYTVLEDAPALCGCVGNRCAWFVN